MVRNLTCTKWILVERFWHALRISRYPKFIQVFLRVNIQHLWKQLLETKTHKNIKIWWYNVNHLHNHYPRKKVCTVFPSSFQLLYHLASNANSSSNSGSTRSFRRFTWQDLGSQPVGHVFVFRFDGISLRSRWDAINPQKSLRKQDPPTWFLHYLWVTCNGGISGQIAPKCSNDPGSTNQPLRLEIDDYLKNPHDAKAYLSPTQIKLEEATRWISHGFSPVIFYLTTQKRPTQNRPWLSGNPQNAMVSTKIHRHEQAGEAFVTQIRFGKLWEVWIAPDSPSGLVVWIFSTKINHQVLPFVTFSGWFEVTFSGVI